MPGQVLNIQQHIVNLGPNQQNPGGQQNINIPIPIPQNLNQGPLPFMMPPLQMNLNLQQNPQHQQNHQPNNQQPNNQNPMNPLQAMMMQMQQNLQQQ
jgi:hypothetical protein